MGSRIEPRVIDGLYTEAMLLADEVRGYFDGYGREERKALDPLVQVGFSCESLKVTTRLMHVLSWLLMRRATAAGEMRHIDGEAQRLAIASESDEAIIPQLPEAARGLIRASRDLYARVGRLDEQDVAEPLTSPARGLQSRLERAF